MFHKNYAARGTMMLSLFSLMIVACNPFTAHSFQSSVQASPPLKARNKHLSSSRRTLALHTSREPLRVNGNTETIQWKRTKGPLLASDGPPGDNNSVGVVRGVVIAVPLVLKLSLVLGIKFIMDLIVFPLLFSYRFLKLIKTRTMALFQGPQTDISSIRKPKVESRSSPW